MDFVALSLKRLRLYWFPDTGSWNKAPYMPEIKAITMWIVTLGVIACGIQVLARRRREMYPALCVALLSCAPYTITHVDLRYRYPVHALHVMMLMVAVTSLTRQSTNRATVPS